MFNETISVTTTVATALVRRWLTNTPITVWATAAISLGYFLWANVGLVEHRAGRFSLPLVAVLVLAVLLRRGYRRAMRPARGEDPPDADKRAS